MVLFGAALVPASLVAGLAALLLLDGVDAAKLPGPFRLLMLASEATVLAIPLLLLAAGLAALLATNAARLKLVAALALASAADLALAALLYHALWTPPCRSHPLPPSPTPMPTVVDATGCLPAH